MKDIIDSLNDHGNHPIKHYVWVTIQVLVVIALMAAFYSVFL